MNNKIILIFYWYLTTQIDGLPCQALKNCEGSRYSMRFFWVFQRSFIFFGWVGWGLRLKSSGGEFVDHNFVGFPCRPQDIVVVNIGCSAKIMGIKDVGTSVLWLVRHSNVVIGISNFATALQKRKENAMKQPCEHVLSLKKSFYWDTKLRELL